MKNKKSRTSTILSTSMKGDFSFAEIVQARLASTLVGGSRKLSGQVWESRGEIPLPDPIIVYSTYAANIDFLS